MTTPPTLIVEQGVVEPLGGCPANLVVVPRRRSPWYRRAHRWAPLDAETVLDTLTAVPRPAVVLARRHAADPGASSLLDLASLLGLEVRRLPDCVEAAAWSVSFASRADESGATAGGRVLDVLCSVPAPTMRWPGIADPPLRANALRRWASCAWRPCPWCPAGGLAGERCARCGSPLEPGEREDGR
jgi:hypothetical protein